MYGEDRDARNTEDQEIDHEGQDNAAPGKPVVDVTLQPVVRRATPELLERFDVVLLNSVQFRTFQQYLLQTVHLRAVRVVGSLAERMVFAMNGNPFPRQHARGAPYPEPEEVPQTRMQIDGTVRLIPVQVQSHRHHGDLQHHQCRDDIARERQVQHAI